MSQIRWNELTALALKKSMTEKKGHRWFILKDMYNI